MYLVLRFFHYCNYINYYWSLRSGAVIIRHAPQFASELLTYILRSCHGFKLALECGIFVP